MRVVVVGLGVQGEKRRRVAGADVVATVDPEPSRRADYASLEDVPTNRYDAALLCVPDGPKVALLSYLAARGKHALVEKPLWAGDDGDFDRLDAASRASGAVIYTAYNHRFEPHVARMRALLVSGALGRIYRCRLFYGNGTARLVRGSEWRDRGGGVVPDLCSHMLDTVRFWFGDVGGTWSVWSADCFENRSPDHAVIGCADGAIRVELEATLLMWRNHFTCDILAENGSAHILSLCKWGPSTFIRRTRILPSGRPVEETDIVPEGDPTWALEYAHFKALVRSGARSDLSNDRWLNGLLRRLGADAARAAAP